MIRSRLFSVLIACAVGLVRAQEAPLFRTPILDPNATSHRQSVCDLQAQIFNGTLKLRDALEGFQLRPMLIESDISSFFLPPGTEVLPTEKAGIIIYILDALAERAGFTWRQSYGIADLATAPSNSTFDDLLEWSAEMYDISANLWLQSVGRLNRGVSFPEGWLDSSIVLVGEKPKSESKLSMWSFLEPFSAGVWCLIIATTLLSSLTYWWMEWYNEGSDEQELSKKPAENLFFAAISFTGDIRYEPSTNYARLFVFSLAFFYLLIGSAYTANLASFLVVQNSPAPTVEGVADAVRQGKLICTVGGTETVTLLKAEHPGIRLVLTESEEDAYAGVKAGDCDFVATGLQTWTRISYNADVNGDCGFTWVGRVFKFLSGGFSVKADSGILCSSLIRDVLNLHMLEMIEEKQLEELWDREYQERATINCDAVVGTSSSSDDGDETQLGVEDMAGIFIVHWGLVVIAIVMAAFSQRAFCMKGSEATPSAKGMKRARYAGNQPNEEEQSPLAKSLDQLNDEPGIVDTDSASLDVIYTKHDKKIQNLASQTRDMMKQMESMLQQLDTAQEESRQIGEIIGAKKTDPDNLEPVY